MFWSKRDLTVEASLYQASKREKSLCKREKIIEGSAAIEKQFIVKSKSGQRITALKSSRYTKDGSALIEASSRQLEAKINNSRPTSRLSALHYALTYLSQQKIHIMQACFQEAVVQVLLKDQGPTYFPQMLGLQAHLESKGRDCDPQNQDLPHLR